MKSSAIFEQAGVREIEWSSFLGSNTCLTFGRGLRSASFHTEGNFCSLYEAFRMPLTGCTKNSAYSFSTQFESPSGPGALNLFNQTKCFSYDLWMKAGA